MKTTNNVQKTVNSQMSRMTLCAGSILLGIVLMSSANAATIRDTKPLVQLLANTVTTQMALSPEEVFSAQEADWQVERFAEKLINLQKSRLTNCLTTEASLIAAEPEVSKESEAQIVKYAQKQLDLSFVKTEKSN